MDLVILFALTAVIFLGIDALGLNLLIKPVFDEQLGDWIVSPIRYAPAVAFYLFYAFALTYLVTQHHLSAPSYPQLILAAAIFGAACYGTYEFSNLATLERWSWRLVIVDTAWGTALTATSATLALALTRAVT